MNQIVVFASGSGSNFQAIIDAIESGSISNAQIAGLVTNNPDAGALTRAKKQDINTAVINPDSFPNTIEYERALLEHIKALRPDLIVLAGYMRKIPDSLLESYPKRIINIHPSLLPKYGGKGFYGMRVHDAVMKAGEAQSGCTVHLVTEAYDEGPILGQRIVDVEPDDSPKDLQQRILAQEHQLLPDVIEQFFSDNINL